MKNISPDTYLILFNIWLAAGGIAIQNRSAIGFIGCFMFCLVNFLLLWNYPDKEGGKV